MSENRVLIAGCGNIGKQIIVKVFSAGYYIDIFDISETNLNDCRKYIYAICAVEKSFLRKIRFLSDYNDLSEDYRFVIECINENPFTKMRFFRKISDIVGEKTFITTTSSTMTASDLLKSVKFPERFCAMHFNAPDVNANIVEIMPHSTTSQHAVNMLSEFILSIGLEPFIMKKEKHSYIFNSLLESLTSTAILLYINKTCDFTEIDTIWKKNTGMKIGPFEMLDITGLDTALDITSLKRKENDNDVIRKIEDLLKKYVKSGKLGKKTGEGFYKYN